MRYPAGPIGIRHSRPLVFFEDDIVIGLDVGSIDLVGTVVGPDLSGSAGGAGQDDDWRAHSYGPFLATRFGMTTTPVPQPPDTSPMPSPEPTPDPNPPQPPLPLPKSA